MTKETNKPKVNYEYNGRASWGKNKHEYAIYVNDKVYTYVWRKKKKKAKKQAKFIARILPDIISTYESMIEDGVTIEINDRLPYVAIEDSNNPDDWSYYFQEQQASELLDDIPEWVNPEHYLLWSAAGW